jgi:stalled ribosome rescue protein Dom34
MNTHHYHAVIWIDHREARVFHFTATDVERLVLHPDHPIRHIHHKAGSIGSGHAAEDHAFLQAVTESIADAGAILIAGPANEKTELAKHIRENNPQLMSAIVALETVDHPSDAQLVAYARKHLKATDRMLPQRP